MIREKTTYVPVKLIIDEKTTCVPVKLIVDDKTICLPMKLMIEHIMRFVFGDSKQIYKTRLVHCIARQLKALRIEYVGRIDKMVHESLN
jgi:hypothetical protein